MGWDGVSTVRDGVTRTESKGSRGYRDIYDRLSPKQRATERARYTHSSSANFGAIHGHNQAGSVSELGERNASLGTSLVSQQSAAARLRQVFKTRTLPLAKTLIHHSAASENAAKLKHHGPSSHDPGSKPAEPQSLFPHRRPLELSFSVRS